MILIDINIGIHLYVIVTGYDISVWNYIKLNVIAFKNKSYYWKIAHVMCNSCINNGKRIIHVASYYQHC